ncbi:MAG: tRNA adenosine(34) deaminase TadA [Pseudomonadota bacterium]
MCEKKDDAAVDSPVVEAKAADGPFGPVPSAPKGWTWHTLMDIALQEASKASHAGEVPVGAVIVSAEGEILATAHNEPIANHDPSAHAEMLAIRKAAEKLKNYRLDGAYLVVTLEPCIMCAGAIVHARLAGVVYGALDHKAGAVCSCMDAFDLPFLNHKPWHMAYVRHEACAQVLRDFFEQRRE